VENRGSPRTNLEGGARTPQLHESGDPILGPGFGISGRQAGRLEGRRRSGRIDDAAIEHHLLEVPARDPSSTRATTLAGSEDDAAAGLVEPADAGVICLAGTHGLELLPVDGGEDSEP